jgi:hypothetical protein
MRDTHYNEFEEMRRLEMDRHIEELEKIADLEEQLWEKERIREDQERERELEELARIEEENEYMRQEREEKEL